VSARGRAVTAASCRARQRRPLHLQMKNQPLYIITSPPSSPASLAASRHTALRASVRLAIRTVGALPPLLAPGPRAPRRIDPARARARTLDSRASGTCGARRLTADRGAARACLALFRARARAAGAGGKRRPLQHPTRANRRQCRATCSSPWGRSA
jgi:hypothetical protein